MQEEMIYYGLRGIPIVAGLITFGLVWFFYGVYEPQKKILATYREISGLLRERRRTNNHYQRLQQWLTQNGVTYHYGKAMTPTKYLILRFVLSALGMVVFGSISWEPGLLASLFLYFLPGWMLLYLNSRDNEHLLPELKLVYNALELQIRAGVYVTDALTECYNSVREKRLRDALLDLAGDIVMRADIYDALERFQARFDNRYIDSLCITLLQALESGQAVELLSDIGEQIRDMEQAVLERKKAALDRNLTFYQLGILTVVLMIALYACVTHMLGAAQLF